jgi:hypothetical protein
MRASNSDLEGAVQEVLQDIYTSIRDFDQNASSAQTVVGLEEKTGVLEQLNKLVGAYQAVATTVLHFSIESPRYGLLKGRQEDGSFVVDL